MSTTTSTEPSPSVDPQRFFAEDASRAELDALEAWAKTTGWVTRPEGLEGRRGGGLKAVRGGPHCELIFGPLRADRCACGRQVGAEFRGVECPRCGVVSGDPELRALRWGHVVCRVGVAHPARPGGTSVRVHHIPVSPPAGRVAGPVPRGLLPVPTAADLAIARLVTACARLDLLTEYRAPEVIIADAQQAADEALAELCGVGGEARGRSIFPGGSGQPPVLTGRAPPVDGGGRSRAHITGLAFHGDTLVVTGRGGVHLLPLTSGRARRVSRGSCRVIGVVGEVAVFDEQAFGSASLNRADGYAALDLRTMQWQTALPGAPRIAFGKDQPEDGWAIEVATGRTAPLHTLGDRPAFGAYTPEMDAMLVLGDDEGRLLDAASGMALWDLASFPGGSVRVESGRRRVPSRGEGNRGGPPAVVHLGGRRWRVLLPSGALGEIEEAGAVVRWLLRGPHSAAAFSPDGTRLAVAQGRRVRVLDTEGRLLRAFELGSHKVNAKSSAMSAGARTPASTRPP